MAKTPKKRANTKGAAKKAAPAKAKPKHRKVKKPARSCLAAVVEQEAKKRQLAGAAQSSTNFSASVASANAAARPCVDARQTNLDTLRQPKVDPAEPTFRALNTKKLCERCGRPWIEHDHNDTCPPPAQPKRYRFRDAITGLFVRARDALRRRKTTVRERVR